MKRFYPILIFVLLSFLVGYFSMLIQQDAMMSWYPSLVKSSLTPPGIAFSIVWSVLYLLMGVSAGLVWNSRELYSWMLAFLFVIQLSLNLLWSFCFFYMQSPVLGFTVLIVLLMFVLLYVTASYIQNRWAAIINVPYIVWLIFAGYLNVYVIIYN